MEKIASELEKAIALYKPLLEKIPLEEMQRTPAPGKWSKKEIIGHLIDSAQNNIRRLVLAQYEKDPLVVYQQDKWVEISGYQDWKESELLDLWSSLNRQMVLILKNTAPESLNATALTPEPHTIGWLAEDYLKHLRHHMHQVLKLDEIAYP